MSRPVTLVAVAWFAACGRAAPPPVLAVDAPVVTDAPASEVLGVDGAVARDVATGPCARDEDCPGGACDDLARRCVACVPSRDACPADRHCEAATATCVAGCRSDDGCLGAVDDAGALLLRCHVVRHACVACVVDAHCPAGSLCAGGVCVPGCSATQPCPAGSACCAGACVSGPRDGGCP